MGETSTGFFLKPSTPYTSEAFKKENVRKYLEGAAGDKAVSVVQLSILNRMSSLAGLAELGEAGRPYGSCSNTHMGGLQR